MKKKAFPMTSKTIDNLLFVQYAPGAGGRFLIVCCTTSNRVANWLPVDLPDPVEFTTERFCNPIYSDHMKTEPKPPYSMGWFTRQYPFTRGDNLSRKQAEKLLLTDEVIANELSHNRFIPEYYGKHYFPKWFNGKVITLVNDTQSDVWLLERRKRVFYMHKNNIVHKLRYMPNFITNSHIVKQYSDQPQTEFSCTDLDSFVKEDFTERMSEGQGINITLTDYLTWEPNKIWDTVDPLVGDIERKWCTLALKTWRNFWL